MSYKCCIGGVVGGSATQTVARNTNTHYHNANLENQIQNGYTGTSFSKTHNEFYKKVDIMAGDETYENIIDHRTLPLEEKLNHTYEKVVFEEFALVKEDFPSTQFSKKEEKFSPSRQLKVRFASKKLKNMYGGRGMEKLLQAASGKEGHAIDRNTNTGYVTKADGCC